jgi:transposase-like protein
LKLEVLRRMAAGENVSGLGREFGVSRKSIYQWRDRYRLDGSMALRSCGRMTKAEAASLSTHQAKPLDPPTDQAARQKSLEELARAQRRIAALEGKIGQQQVELDFFQQALRQVREQRRKVEADRRVVAAPVPILAVDELAGV